MSLTKIIQNDIFLKEAKVRTLLTLVNYYFNILFHLVKIIISNKM